MRKALILLTFLCLAPLALLAQVISYPSQGLYYTWPSVRVTGAVSPVLNLQAVNGIPPSMVIHVTQQGTVPSVCTFEVEGSATGANGTWSTGGAAIATGQSCTGNANLTFYGSAKYIQILVQTWTQGDGTSAVVFSYARGAATGGGGSMVYPGSGVPVSTGAAWGSSLSAPASALVGISDTQTLTNKTLDGVSATTMGYMDPTSSIQTQINGKQATLSDAANLVYSDVAKTITAALTFGSADLIKLGSTTLPTGGYIDMANNTFIYGENSAGTTSAAIFGLNSNGDLLLGAAVGGTQAAGDILTGLPIYNSANSSATSGTNFAAPGLYSRAHIWHASANTNDDMYWQNAPAASGADPTVTMKLQHTTTGTGAWGFSIPWITNGTAISTAAAGAAAGTSPTVTDAGNNLDFTVNVTTGTSPTTGTLATVTFGSTAPSAPRCTQPAALNAASSGAAMYNLYQSTSTTVFTLSTNVALTASTAYSWSVHCAY